MPSKPKIPQKKSPGEEAFALHCCAERLVPEREYYFHPKRKFRFDFAFPAHKLAVEVEGGMYGRHQRVGGFEGDCLKYGEAAILGWRVIRVTTRMVMSGAAIDMTLRALGKKARGNHE